MSDLLLEFWPDQKAEGGTAKQVNWSSAKKRVQDINVWLQCYAIYVGVMATKIPRDGPRTHGLYDQHSMGQPRI